MQVVDDMLRGQGVRQADEQGKEGVKGQVMSDVVQQSGLGQVLHVVEPILFFVTRQKNVTTGKQGENIVVSLFSKT